MNWLMSDCHMNWLMSDCHMNWLMSDCHITLVAFLFVSLVTEKLTNLHAKSGSLRQALQLRAVCALQHTHKCCVVL